MKFVVIRQCCDKKRAFNLNEGDQVYAASEIEDWSERLKKASPVNLTQTSSIDTGDRRQFERYMARYVKVKIRVEPSPGTSTPASVEKRQTAGTSTCRDSGVKSRH